MKCTNCGYEHNGNFCPNCGAQASTQNSDLVNDDMSLEQNQNFSEGYTYPDQNVNPAGDNSVPNQPDTTQEGYNVTDQTATTPGYNYDNQYAYNNQVDQNQMYNDSYQNYTEQSEALVADTKKTKKFLIWTIIFIILGTILIIGGIICGIAICGSNDEDTAKANFESFMGSMKSADFENAVKYVKGGALSGSYFEDTTETKQETTKLIMSNLSYKVNSVTKNSDTQITINADVTNKDMSQVMGQTMVKALSGSFYDALNGDNSQESIDKKMNEILKKTLKDSSIKTVTAKVDVIMEKVDSNWLIVGNDEFSDALLGGISKFTNNMNDYMNQIPSETAPTTPDPTFDTITPTDAPTEPAQSKDVKYFGIGDTIKTETFSITLEKASYYSEFKDEYMTYTPDEGKVYMVLFLDVKNISNKREIFSDWNVKANCDKTDVDSTYLLVDNVEGYEQLSDDLDPGISKKGYIAFEIDKNWNEFIFYYLDNTFDDVLPVNQFKVERKDFS